MRAANAYPGTSWRGLVRLARLGGARVAVTNFGVPHDANAAWFGSCVGVAPPREVTVVIVRPGLLPADAAGVLRECLERGTSATFGARDVRAAGRVRPRSPGPGGRVVPFPARAPA